MNSDFSTPKFPPDPQSSQSREGKSSGVNNDPVLPDEEMENVLNFLNHAQPLQDDTTPHFISSLVGNPQEQLNPSVLPTNTEKQQVITGKIQASNHTYDPLIKINEPTYLIISNTHENKALEVVNHQSTSNDNEASRKTDPEPIAINPEQLVATPSNSTSKPESASIDQPPDTQIKQTAETVITDSLESLPEAVEIHPLLQVQLKSQGGKLQVILPSEVQVASSKYSWGEIWQQFQVRLHASDRLLVANAGVHLDAKDRLLDGRQLQELSETFSNVKLNLESITTSRRQTAIAAVTAGYSVEQVQAQNILRSPDTDSTSTLADPIYLETTVRSGVEIRHPGTIIILGDVNPGGIVVADGDILIWGRLRGVAHAGAGGNRECLIMALQMEPTQLRIANAVARAPEKSPQQFHAEVAHITSDTIRITRADDFSRAQFLNRIDPSKFNAN